MREKIINLVKGLLCLGCVGYIGVVYLLTHSPFVMILIFLMIVGTIDIKMGVAKNE